MNDPYAYTDISTLLPGILSGGIYKDGEVDRLAALDECEEMLSQAGRSTTKEKEAYHCMKK